MNRLPESVTTKFIELFATLKHATDDLKMAGADAFLIGDHSQVAVFNDSCRNLQVFEAEIKSAVNNFASNNNPRSAEKGEFSQKGQVSHPQTERSFTGNLG